MTEIIVPTTTTNKGRPIIKVSFKQPDGKWSAFIEMNFDTGATYPTDIPIGIAPKWGRITNSDQKYYKDTPIKIEGFTNEFKIEVCLQDKDHYDLFKSQPPPTRFPLLRVRDMAQYMSFVFAKENTTMTLGTSQPQALKDAVAQGKSIPRLADMKRRTGTPTSGWQWYKADLINPVIGEKSNDWFPVNTGERQAIVKRSLCDKVHLIYPDLGSDGRADSKATISYTESNPLLTLSNVTIQVRDDDEDFARGGEPRNLIGGPPILDNWKIVLWSSYLHLAFIPR
jgi:hypothetical protein